MIEVKNNITFNKGRVNYDKRFNSFIFAYQKNDNNSINEYIESTHDYSYNDILKVLNKITKIGKIVDDIINSKNMLNNKVTAKSNKNDIQINEYKEFLEKCNINYLYDIFSSLQNEIKSDKLPNKVLKPIETITFNGYEDFIVNSQKPNYKNDLIENILSLINIAYHKNNLITKHFLDFFISNNNLTKNLNNNFEKRKTLYNNLKSKILSFIKHYSLPSYINLKIIISDTNHKYGYDSIHNQFGDVKQKRLENPLEDFANYSDENLLNTFKKFVEPNKILLKIETLEVSLNTFIYTCYYLYYATQISNLFLKYEKNDSNCNFNKLRDIYFKLFNENLDLLSVENCKKIILSAFNNIRKLIEENNKESKNNYGKLHKCNNYNLMQYENNYLKDEHLTYSTLNEAIWDFFFKVIFLKIEIDNNNNNNKRNYLFKCKNCGNYINKKPHFLKKEKYITYLCDECFKIRKKTLAKLRKEKYNKLHKK